MLRLLLPPNLAAAAPRDAIAVRVELDLAIPPAPGLVPALAILQRLGVAPQPVSLIQLKRAQLRELVQALLGERVFFRADRPTLPLAWNGIDLPGVSEHLREPAAPTPAPPRPVKPQPREIPAPDLTPLTVDGSEHYLAITLPSRESMVYDAALEFLRAHRFILDPLTRKWWLRDRHKVLNLLATHGALLRDNLHAEFTPNFEKNTARLQAATIAAQISEAVDGYDVTLGLAAGTAPDAQIRSAVATGRGSARPTAPSTSSTPPSSPSLRPRSARSPASSPPPAPAAATASPRPAPPRSPICWRTSPRTSPRRKPGTPAAPR